MLIDFPGGQGPLPVGGHHLDDLGTQTVRCHRRLPPVRCPWNGPIANGGIINDAGPVDATSRDGFLGETWLISCCTTAPVFPCTISPEHRCAPPGEECSCRDFTRPGANGAAITAGAFGAAESGIC